MVRYSPSWKKKKLIVFDLDGTLARSKQPLSRMIARLLVRLLEQKRVAVISGGKLRQFKDQVVTPLSRMRQKPAYENLFLFPTTAMSFYRYRKGWKSVYQKKFAPSERREVFEALRSALREIGYRPRRVYGTLIEDRGTQITFSGLGQKAPLQKKKRWNKKNDVRPELLKLLRVSLPKYEVRSGGLTSVDVTKKGIDKAFGIRQMEKYLKIRKKEMLFVGDALQRGGNDAPVKGTGVVCVAVRDPKETEGLLQFLVA